MKQTMHNLALKSFYITLCCILQVAAKALETVDRLLTMDDTVFQKAKRVSRFVWLSVIFIEVLFKNYHSYAEI